MKKLLFVFALFMLVNCEKEVEVDYTSDFFQKEINAKTIKKPDKKVDVCHKGRIISISLNSVKAHLAHGDAIDGDGDGYFNKENACSDEIDCNDEVPTIHPGAVELCSDDLDNDCNGLIDCQDETCIENTACLCGVNCRPTPYLINGLNLNLLQSGSVNISADLLDAGSYDECGCPLTFSFSEDPDDQTRVLDCSDLGELPVNMWVTNPAGNQDFGHTYIYIQDNLGVCNGNLEYCIPLVVARSGYSTALPASSQITIDATEFIWYSEDICGTGQLTYSIKKQGDPNHPSESIILNCDDLGTNILELWVNDGFNSAMVTTTIDLQDNNGNCH
jgi:hypothetical protein